jgi:uncharacterized protein
VVDGISADEARRMALRAQGILGRSQRPATPGAVLERLGALQLDTIAVLARSHELVCYARCGPVGRMAVEAACWGQDRAGEARCFEYWAHAACILPIAEWPWFAFRRRHLRQKRRWSLDAPVDTIAHVRRQLADRGPLSASELGGAKEKGPWWDWSPVKRAVELLLDWGEVVCVTRRGWKRVYDLTERALPAGLLATDPDDTACLVHLVEGAGARLGVATRRDLAEYFRLRVEDVLSVLPATNLVPVQVETWTEPAWADPTALTLVGLRGQHRTTLLSPFDSLLWDRRRTERLWGFTHRLEAYTPAPKRVHGYYTMPVLAGGQLVGRVDPARSGTTLVARQVSVINERDLPAVASALMEAAAWVGAGDVAVEVVNPPHLRPALVSAVAGAAVPTS